MNPETQTRWNPRYVAYAAAHGRDPEAMLAHDEDAWPGGRMVGFLTWLPEQYRKWSKETGETPAWAGNWSDDQLGRFDAWLSSQQDRRTE